jgi:hypothetical protein
MTPAIVKTMGNDRNVKIDPVFPDLKQRYAGWHRVEEWYHLEWDSIIGGMTLNYNVDLDTNIRGPYGSGIW